VKRVAAAVAGLAGLVIVLVVAGCGAGQDTQTATMPPAVNGALGQAGPIAIRNAQFAPPNRGVYPAGTSAALILAIVNTGTTDDELTEVSSPVADEVEISGDRSLVANRTLQVSGAGPAAPQSSSAGVTPTSNRPTSSSSSSSSSSASSSASGSSTPTSSSSAAPPVELGKATIVLKNLSSPLYVGQTYPVTFVFRKAGSVTIQLPVANPPSARPEPTSASHG
jgi:copper(I)-binding protein